MGIFLYLRIRRTTKRETKIKSNSSTLPTLATTTTKATTTIKVTTTTTTTTKAPVTTTVTTTSIKQSISNDDALKKIQTDVNQLKV